MSRGIAFYEPREFKVKPSFAVYDAGYVYFGTSGTIKRFYVEDYTGLTQKQLDSAFAPETWVTEVPFSEDYSNVVIVDNKMYVPNSAEWTSFTVIDMVTKAKTVITTPEKPDGSGPYVMHSNFTIEQGKVFGVSTIEEKQTSDQHKLFSFDFTTNRWDNTVINSKKQTEPHKIFCGNTHVYVCNYTDFSISYYNMSDLTFGAKLNFNGYPGVAVDALNNTFFVTSSSGMLSVLDDLTKTVTHSYSTLLPMNTGNCTLLANDIGYVWFANGKSVGRLKLSDKSIILIDDPEELGAISELAEKVAEAKEGQEFAVKEDNNVYVFSNGAFSISRPSVGDHKILKAIFGETIDSNYTKLPRYALSNDKFNGFVYAPGYTVVNQFGQTAIKDKLIICGEVMTIIDPDLIRFVFDKPIVVESGVGVTGKAMITTGDTGYIGEFK